MRASSVSASRIARSTSSIPGVGRSFGMPRNIARRAAFVPSLCRLREISFGFRGVGPHGATLFGMSTRAQAPPTPDIRDSILDTVGDTPLVRLSRVGAGGRDAARREGRGVQSGRLDQGPRRDRDDRGRRARRAGCGRAARSSSRRPATPARAWPSRRDSRAIGSIAVMPDKMSREKIDLLRAYGAEVVVAPTNVAAGLARVLLPGGRPPGRRDPRRLPAQPVLQRGQPGGPLRARPAPRSGSRRRGGSPTWSSASARAARSPAPGATSRSATRPRRRRRRPRRLDLLGRRGERQAVPRRGRGRGLLAADVRPGDRRPLDHASPTATPSS